MIFTERDEKFYACDKAARKYLTGIGKKISDGLTLEEVSSPGLGAAGNLEIVSEAKAKQLEEINEAIKL